jgi:hypothetical protein
MTKILWAMAALLAASASSVTAGGFVEAPYTPIPEVVEQFTYSWVAMPLLPRRYQNHCGFYRGHFICADHCGIDYQIYYCAPGAAGCCHIGRGYCDGGGNVRCLPALF